MTQFGAVASSHFFIGRYDFVQMSVWGVGSVARLIDIGAICPCGEQNAGTYEGVA
jgi:hypothetical protein